MSKGLASVSAAKRWFKSGQTMVQVTLLLLLLLYLLTSFSLVELLLELWGLSSLAISSALAISSSVMEAGITLEQMDELPRHWP